MNKFLLISTLANEGLEDLIEYINNNDLQYVYIFILIFIIITNILTWLKAYKKGKAEIRQMDTETKLKRVELIEKYQKYRISFNEASSLLQLQILEVINKIQEGNVAGVKKAREDLKDLFFNEFIPKFNDYVEVHEIETVNEKKKKTNFIDNEIFRFFTSVENFYLTVNNQSLLNKIEQPKVVISKETVIPLVNIVDENLSFISFKRKKRVNEFLKTVDITVTNKWRMKRKFK